jgi:hypothetical protein
VGTGAGGEQVTSLTTGTLLVSTWSGNRVDLFGGRRPRWRLGCYGLNGFGWFRWFGWSRRFRGSRRSQHGMFSGGSAPYLRLQLLLLLIIRRICYIYVNIETHCGLVLSKIPNQVAFGIKNRSRQNLTSSTQSPWPRSSSGTWLTGPRTACCGWAHASCAARCLPLEKQRRAGRTTHSRATSAAAKRSRPRSRSSCRRSTSPCRCSLTRIVTLQ